MNNNGIHRKKDSARIVWDSKPHRAPNPKDIEFQTAEVVIPNPETAGQLPISFRDKLIGEEELDKQKMNRLIWGDNLLAMQALLNQGYEGKIALIYIGSGLLIAVFSGIIIGKLKVENLVEEFVYNHKINPNAITAKMSWQDRFEYAKTYILDILKKIWPYILIGIGIGAFIHGYVPTDFIARYAGADKWYAVPLATIIGIPLYSNAAGVIPLVSALTEKGVAIGTTLAFMMAVTGLSLPEFMILKKVMKPKLILIFAGIVGIGIILTGYLFNAIF